MPDDSTHSGSLAFILALLFLIGVLLGSSGAIPTGNVVAGPSDVGPTEVDAHGPQRVLITPRSDRANVHARSIPGVDIKHEFKGRFSAEVPTAALPKLKTLADVEPVPLLDLHQDAPFFEALGLAARKPTCGNKICEGKEKRTCPNDCAAVMVRTCTPDAQRDYNVLQVAGGTNGQGAGVNVAVLDTGTTIDHLDLKTAIKMCVDTTGVGVQNGCADTDSVAHGTHTTGIVGANGGSDASGAFGVAPSSNLFAVKVCATSSCYADDIAEGIDYAASKGAHIISMSFGSSGESSLISDAIRRHPQVLFIASAGNSGPGPNTINYPAALPEVIAVAANDQNKAVTWFSSRGITDGDDSTITSREVELSAGGLNIEAPTSNGCYSRLSGTSFSAPTVSGLAAAVWDQADGIIDGKGNPLSTREYLRLSARDITVADGGGATTGFDSASGYGLPLFS